MDELYPTIRLVHITAVALSGSLFAVRGILMLVHSPRSNHWTLRYLSYAIDITLLLAAIKLTTILHQYPFVNGWLTTKVVLLVVYILLGLQALKYGHTHRCKTVCFVLALLVFLSIASVARTHHPLGFIWFMLAK